MIFSILFLLSTCSPVGQWDSPPPIIEQVEEAAISIPQEECSYHEVWITAYTATEEECGKADGITASGEVARRGMIAADWLPFGTEVEINGEVYVVKDRFGDGKYGKIDIYVDSIEEANQIGRYKTTVKVRG